MRSGKPASPASSDLAEERAAKPSLHRWSPSPPHSPRLGSPPDAFTMYDVGVTSSFSEGTTCLSLHAVDEEKDVKRPEEAEVKDKPCVRDLKQAPAQKEPELKPEDMQYIIRDTSTGMTYDIRSQNATSMLLNHVEQSLTKLPETKSKKPWEEWWRAKRLNNRLLIEAIEQNSRERVLCLLDSAKYGDLAADVNAKQHDDMTPLHAAASEGRAELVELLLRHGAHIDPVNTSLRTPLHVGCNRGSKNVIELLVDAGANINAQEKDGNTPTHILSSCGWIEALTWFITRGPDLAIKNIYGESAVEVAANLEVRQVLALALQPKPTKDADTYNRKVVQGIILHNNRADMIKTLMYRGQLINEQLPMEPLPEEAKKSVPSSAKFTKPVPIPAGSKRKIVKIIEATKKLIKMEENSRPAKTEDTAPAEEEAAAEGESTVGPENFEPINILGRGSFGEVFLVKYRKTGKKYAMKVLDKRRVLSQNLVRYAQTERNVLCFTRHPFIVGLDFAFQTAEKLFMIMEYCPG